jgi:hypothetical protein
VSASCEAAEGIVPFSDDVVKLKSTATAKSANLGHNPGTLVGLIESLATARAAGQLARRLRVLSHPELLIRGASCRDSFN